VKNRGCKKKKKKKKKEEEKGSNLNVK